MIGLTMCSGIGAPELAAPWVDWRFASEIEPFPRAVLSERFGYKLPEDQNQGDPLLWGDMTEITPDMLRSRGIPAPDLVVAGTPCQAFSVAGLRNGTADARGNLTMKFVEIVHELVSARPDGKLAVVWENVPGILSDKGNAFGCFLGGLVGAMDALQPPADGSWPGEGMVQGPRARLAWAVLDAQWFRVAQRRRRVFVVIDFGGCIDPAAVLLEPDSLRGDSAPRREAGQSAAQGAAPGIAGGGPDNGRLAGTVSSKWAKGTGGPAGDECYNLVAHALRAKEHLSHRADQDTLIPVTHALRGEGFDASEDGTGRGTPIVPVAFDCKGTEAQYTEDGSHPTLRSMGHSNSHQNAGGHAAVAFDMRGRDGGAMPEGPHPTANIRAASGGSSRSYVALPWAVRRLTPRECERLQGMPDDHTLIGDRPARRKLEADELAYLRRTYPDLTDEDAQRLAADGPRYKAIGNSMAVPVMKWILDRVRASFLAQQPEVSRFYPRGIPASTRSFVMERDGEKCRYCGSTDGPFHLDHVMPWSRGGSNDEGNLVVACSTCNIEKSDRTPEEMGWHTLPIKREPKLIKPPKVSNPNWMHFASQSELEDLDRLAVEIEKIKAEQSLDLRERDKIMRRCIRRIRRAAGKD